MSIRAFHAANRAFRHFFLLFILLPTIIAERNFKYTQLIIRAIILFLFLSLRSYAQEENPEIALQATRYVDLKVNGIARYNKRIERQQKLILCRLKKKETRFAHKLKRKDSAAYARYVEQSISFDSIKTLSSSDSIDSNSSIAQRNNGKIDSLKKIEAFAAKKGDNISINNKELDQLKSHLNYRNYINELINKRTSFLKSLSANAEGMPGLKGIEKQVFYGKERMKVFKQMEDDPTVAEDKALEYLQGTEGFSEAMSNNSPTNSMAGMDAGQLEKMGYQTKQVLQKNLQEKFGGSLGGVADKMSGQIKAWQDKQKELDNVKQTKKNLTQLKNTEKPSFKINPMRGVPFWKRIEKQYSWQTQRANESGGPALFILSAGAGFKHTPRLTYGIGLTSSLGLGQNWQNIHFSFEGIGYKTYATWLWQYGIGVYAGYEKLYKRAVFTKDKPPPELESYPTNHSTTKYSESLLIGAYKNYSINKKYKGAIQLLYDVWWQQKNLRSPIVLRFVTVKI